MISEVKLIGVGIRRINSIDGLLIFNRQRQLGHSSAAIGNSGSIEPYRKLLKFLGTASWEISPLGLAKCPERNITQFSNEYIDYGLQIVVEVIGKHLDRKRKIVVIIDTANNSQ